MSIIGAIFGLFIAQPWAAFIVSAVIAAAAGFSGGSRFVFATAVAWALYGAWEYLVQIRTPEADIRVDLLLIAPLLIILTLVSLYLVMKGVMNR